MGARHENNGRKTAHGGAVNIHCLLTGGRHFYMPSFFCAGRSFEAAWAFFCPPKPCGSPCRARVLFSLFSNINGENINEHLMPLYGKLTLLDVFLSPILCVFWYNKSSKRQGAEAFADTDGACPQIARKDKIKKKWKSCCKTHWQKEKLCCGKDVPNPSSRWIRPIRIR